MKAVLFAVLTPVMLVGGGAAAAPSVLGPTLSFTITPIVSDAGFGPFGGGICLGNARITEPEEDGGVSWSPDGTRLAFYRRTGNLTADVFVANADGSHLRNLTRGSAQFSWAPDWSPDGNRIVYVAAGRTIDQLVTIRPDGTDGQPVPGTAVDPNDLLASPQWRPDGAAIGYVLNSGIHVVNADGSGGRLLLANAGGMDWSPDGRRIAFTRNTDLALADADGGNVDIVTHTPNLLEGAAEWSPDGSKMVYVSLDETDPKVEEGPGDHMYLADTNGRNRHELRGPPGAWSPAWRPSAPRPNGTRPCVVRGTRHADVIVGTPKGDLIYAGQGNDVVRGRGGNDIIVGDVPFSAHPGNDRLYGGPGRDFIDSYDGRRDLVDGGSGRDRAIFDPHDRVRSIERRG